MDVTPQLIEQIDFPEKFRGYDPDEVDDFLERCGATITELTNRVNEAQSRVFQAEADLQKAREAASSAAPVAMTDEQEIEHATRTLVLAKRTADAVMAEARQEAARLVSEARDQMDAAQKEATAETDRLLSEARATHENAIRSAREDAEREFGVHRDRHQEEIRSLEGRKRTLESDIQALEGRLDQYLGDLRRVHDSVKSVIDDPQVLRVRPPLDLSTTDSSSFVETTAHEWRGARLDEFDADDPADASRRGEESAPVPPPPPAPSFSAARLDAPIAPPVAATDGFVAPAPPEAVPGDSAGTADPWGPGSWSNVTDSPEGEPEASPATAAYDGPGFGGAAVDPNARFASRTSRDHTGFQAPADPTQDRYLRQLDEAVNGPDVELDRAMSNFFEGDEGDSPHFGR